MDRSTGEEPVKITVCIYKNGNSDVPTFMVIRACDLTPLHVFLWGYAKDHDYFVFYLALLCQVLYFTWIPMYTDFDDNSNIRSIRCLLVI